MFDNQLAPPAFFAGLCLRGNCQKVNVLLFSAATFHICINSPVETARASESVCWLLFSLSFPGSTTHLQCRFMPSPHVAEHRLSFLNQ